jgi:hypothetical protein
LYLARRKPNKFAALFWGQRTTPDFFLAWLPTITVHNENRWRAKCFVFFLIRARCRYDIAKTGVKVCSACVKPA